MDCVSTRNPKARGVPFLNAIQMGQAPDGGLFVPISIPQLTTKELAEFSALDFQEVAVRLAQKWLAGELPSKRIRELTQAALDFPVPLQPVAPGVTVMELFHGPSLSFKDFGARFLAKFLSVSLAAKKKRATVLVATSGDTGSAVAMGFHNVVSVEVVLLYPKNKVSPLQEKQMTTLGGNITAVAVEGTFDDCQHLVKQAFSDPKLKPFGLTSANSINIGRLIPQSFYYVYAYSKCQALTVGKSQLVPGTYCIVPSGNLGNLTAGVLAKRMGAPIAGFIAALNANDVFAQYLKVGSFEPKQARATISNAMDVGNPSNLERLQFLYGHDTKKMGGEIQTISISDKKTRETIHNVFQSYHYILDPHGAVGWAAWEKIRTLRQAQGERWKAVLLETAHPAKFYETVEPEIGQKIPLPPSLQRALKRPKKNVVIAPKEAEFFAWLKKTF